MVSFVCVIGLVNSVVFVSFCVCFCVLLLVWVLFGIVCLHVSDCMLVCVLVATGVYGCLVVVFVFVVC